MGRLTPVVALIHMDSPGRVGGFPYRGRYWAEKKRQEIIDNQLIFIVGAFTIVFIAIKNYECQLMC